MPLIPLSFTKDWTDPTDFPTIETDEAKVRADMQLLHNEVRDYINEDLIPTLEDEYARKEELDDIVAGISPDLEACEEILSEM